MNLPHLFMLAATLALFPISALHAALPESLEMDEHGMVSILSDRGETLQFSFGLTDLSEGFWKRPAIAPAFEEQSGQEIDWSGEYGFPDGSFVELKLNMQIKGSDIDIKSSWPSESAAPGFGMMILIVPQEVAEDLTIEVNGQVMFKNFETEHSSFFDPGSEVVFRKTSTGEFLFKFSSADSGSGLQFWTDNRENGLHLRIGGPANESALISDVTELSGTISFKE